MSVNLEKATTRNLLDGLRSYLTTFETQRDQVREGEAPLLTDSMEHHLQLQSFGDVLPRLQYYSFVILLTLIVEARLSVFCNTMHEEHGLPCGLEGRGGDLLERARGFLQREVRLEPPGDLWRWLSDLSQVRDCIVHSAGNLNMLDPADRREIVSAAKRRPGLAVVSDDQLFNRAPHPSLRLEQVLHVEAAFCLEAVTAAQGVFGYLYQHRDA